MPRNSDKRPGSVPGIRPPTYVNVPTPVAYASVPDALVVTMLRILGLCWTNRYRHTPPLTFEQLARLLDRPRSTLQRHLDLLERELGWLRREGQGRRFILHPCPPFSVHSAPQDLEPSPGPSESLEDAQGDGRQPSHIAGEPSANGHDRARSASESSGATASCSSADAELPGSRQDLLHALASVGIENPARERIALDPAVKADWVAAWQLWAEHPARANLSNLPGYIVSCLKHRERPPENYLRLVRLTPAEDSQLQGSRWDDAGDLDPDLRAIRPLYMQHFVDRRRG